MILKVFSVRDEKTRTYMRPIFDAHTASALRSWSEIVNEPSSPMCKFPSDFSLYEVGQFDDEQGQLIPIVPHLVATALEYKQAPQEPLPFRTAN